MSEPYQQLEKEWAAFNGLDPAGMVACASGTAALHLALEAFRLPLGSEVIVPDFTMVACPRAISLAGMKTILVDCGDDLNLDANLLERLGSTTAQRALMAVHIYGRQCDIEGIGYWCKVSAGGPISKPVLLVEDLAEAHGVRPNRYTDAAAWSYYRNKIVAGEEGGAVWFRDQKYATLARQLRSLGFTPEHDFNHIPRGHNYRLSNAHADLILESLRHYDANLKFRRWAESTCDRFCPLAWQQPPREVPWVYDLRIPRLNRQRQAEVIKSLNGAGISARMSFLPMSLQQEYRECKQVTAEGYSRAVISSEQVLYLPLQPGTITEERIKQSFEIIAGVYENRS